MIIVRGDCGFCRDDIMTWIEKPAQPSTTCFGLARNSGWKRCLSPPSRSARRTGLQRLVLAAASSGSSEGPGIEELEGSARRFAELRYRTLDSWSRERRVIGKAEITNGKKNPRYIVTDLRGDEDWARGQAAIGRRRDLYEKFYCARGDMENRIKEQQLDLFADRTSTRPWRAINCGCGSRPSPIC